MPLHRDATYVNLHPPLGASLDTSDQPLNLLESAYAMHWRNHNARDALLVDTSFANSTRVTLGNSTDPTYLVLPGASIVEADRAIFPVRSSDPSEPGTGVALYAKDVAGVDHLFARVDDGTIYQLTPLASGSFDPEAITLADNTSGALLASEGANDYLRVNTTNSSEAVILGNATTNPAFTFLGSGLLTLGSGRIVKTGSIIFGDHTVVPSGTGVIAIGSKSAGTVTANDWIQIGHSSGNAAAGAVVIAPRSLSGNAGIESITINGLSSGGVATGIRAVALGRGTAAAGDDSVALGRNASSAGIYGVALGGDSSASATDGIAIGRSATAGHRAVALGRGASSSAANQVVVGGNGQPLSDFFLGEGVTKSTALTVSEVSIQPTERTGTNAAGVPLWLVGGRGTGTGTGGSVIIRGYPSGTTGTTPHTAANLYEFAPTGIVVRSGMVAIGSFSAAPSHANTIAIGEHTSASAWSATENIYIGRSTGANSGARAVSISSVGRSGNAGADSITIQSAGGGGATGSRSVQIGGAATTAGAEAIGIGYGTAAAHANTVCLGRSASSTAASQCVIGGNGQPITDFYLGEGVTQSSAYTATGISFAPTEATGTNRDGLPLTIRGGRGTGTGNAGATNGSITLTTYPEIGTGTTQHTATPRVRVRADGVALQCSHNAMSSVELRDQARHWQTGSVTTPDASTVYVITTVAPEDTAGNDKIYAVRGSYVAWSNTGSKTLACFQFTILLEIVAGVASINSWNQIAANGASTNGTGNNANFRATGATLEIINTTTGSHLDGEASCVVEWHGIDQEV